MKLVCVDWAPLRQQQQGYYCWQLLAAFMQLATMKSYLVLVFVLASLILNYSLNN